MPRQILSLITILIALSRSAPCGEDAVGTATTDTLTLDQAKALLLAHNPTIAAAKHAIAIAHAQAVTASYRPNPTLSVAAEQFTFKQPFSGLGSDNSSGGAANKTYTVHVEQVFERGDKRSLRVENAQFLSRAAEAQLADTVRQQLFALKQAFLSALLARENLAVADENIEVARTTEALIKTQVNGGNRSESELISFQVGAIQFQQDRTTAQLALDQSLNDLGELLDLKATRIDHAAPAAQLPGTGFPVLVGKLEIEPENLDITDLLVSAEQRSDVVNAQRTADAARTGISLAKSQRSLDLTVGVEYQRVGSDNTFGVTSSIPLPLFNNHRGDIDQAEAQLRQAEAQLLQARRHAESEIEKAYLAYAVSRQLLVIYSNETLAKARSALDIARTSYQGGATGRLELLDAQRTYNQVRVAANQAHFAYRSSLTQLELTTGKDVVGH